MNFKPMRAAVGQVWNSKSVRGQFNPGSGSFKSSVGSVGSQINDAGNQTAGVFGRAAGSSPANAPKGGLGFSPNSAAEYNSPAKAANGFGGMFARWGNAGKGVSGFTGLGVASAQRATQAKNLRAARSVGHGAAGGFALESNLKPALRELAARSQKLKEFAMVRNADGQFVEDEGGMGVGTAVKAGAGAAALGGAGYGAYRGHNAVMSRFGTFGPMEAGKSRMGEAYKGAGAAGLNAVKGAGATGLNAAKKSGFGTRLRGALLGAARWMK